jgi:hypothetical protein
MKTRIAAALLGGALSLSPGLALAEEGAHSLEQLAVEMAQTPDQHAALARHFRAKAAELRAESERHAAMGRSYIGGKAAERAQMKGHCDAMSQKYTALASDYEALAKLEDQAAKK